MEMKEWSLEYWCRLGYLIQKTLDLQRFQRFYKHIKMFH